MLNLLILSFSNVLGNLLESSFEAFIVLNSIVYRGQSIQLTLRVLEHLLKVDTVNIGFVILLL